MGLGGIKKGPHRRSRMRNFNWDTLSKARVEGTHNIWTAQREQGEYELDTAHMEELFSHGAPESSASQNPKTLHRQSLRGLPPSAAGVEMVSILNPKRSMNVGIFLKQFRRPVRDMIADISSGTSEKFAAGKLREFCKMLPEEGEVGDLNNFKGNESALTEADLFMFLLVRIPSYEERLSCLVLQEEFLPLVEDMKKSVSVLTAATKELLECENLHSVIHLVRKTGNYMNAGGYAGSAIGFRMASLLKLVDTKANKPGMNLMHYVVMQVEKIDSNLLRFPQELKLMGAASRINKDDLEAEFQKEVKRVQAATVDAEKQEDLKTQMDGFLKGAVSSLAEMEQDLEALNAASDAVAQFFCEDPTKFKLQECFSIFNSFCEKFMRAIQENKDRIAAEVKKKNRLQLAAKRRSTATCSSCDREVKGMELESFLHNFASSRSSRRRMGKSPSNKGSPNGGSPNNGSLSEIGSVGEPPAAREGPDRRSPGVACEEKGTQSERDSAAPNSTDSSRRDEAPPTTSGVSDAVSQTADVEVKLPAGTKVERGVATDSTRKSDSSSSAGERFVGMFDRDGVEKEAEHVGNTAEEAQKLREASRKVLRYQSSRGSISSGDQVLDKSPGPAGTSPHRRTFDLDAPQQVRVAESKDESEDKSKDGKDSERRPLSELPFSERRPLSELPFSNGIGRRHTLCLPPTLTKHEEDDEVWLPPKDGHKPSLRDLGKMKSVDAGLYGGLIARRLFDNSQDIVKTSDSEGGSPSPMAEKKSKMNSPFPLVLPGEEVCKQTPAGTSSETAASNPPKKPLISPWLKSDFFGFFKRFTKQPNTKEHVHRGNESSV